MSEGGREGADDFGLVEGVAVDALGLGVQEVLVSWYIRCTLLLERATREELACNAQECNRERDGVVGCRNAILCNEGSILCNASSVLVQSLQFWSPLRDGLSWSRSLSLAWRVTK